MTRHWGRFQRTGATPWFRRTGARPWMLVHRSPCLSPLSLQPPAELVCARWSLAVAGGQGDQKFRWHLAYREGRLPSRSSGRGGAHGAGAGRTAARRATGTPSMLARS
jgi:hypothetical protein